MASHAFAHRFKHAQTLVLTTALVFASGNLPAYSQSTSTQPDKNAAATAAANAATEILTRWLESIDAADGFSVQAGDVLAGDRNRSASIQNGLIRYTVPSPDFFNTGDLDITVSFNEMQFKGLRTSDGFMHAGSIEIPGSFDLSVKLVPRHTMDSETLSGPDRAVTFEASYDDLLFEGITAPLSLPKMAATGPSASILAYLTAFRDVKIARAFAAEATATTHIDDSQNSSTHYEDLVLIGLDDGRLAEQSVGKMRTIEKILAGPESAVLGDMDFTSGRISLYGFDIVPIAALLGGTAEPDRTQVLDREEITDMRFAAGDVTGSIEDILIENIEVLSLQPLELFRLIDKEAGGQAVSEDELGRASLKALGVFSLGRFESSSVEIKVDGGTSGLHRFLVRDLNGRGFGEISLDDLEINMGDEGAVFVGHAGINRVTLPPLGALLALDGVDEPTPAQILAALPTIGKIIVSSLEVQAPDLTGDGSKESANVSLALLELLQGGFVSNIPTRSSLIVDGLTLPVSQLSDPDLEEVLGKLGVEELELNHGLSLNWDSDTKDLDLKNISVQILGGGTASLSLRLGNVQESLFTTPELAQLALASATVKSGHLRIEGAELISAFISDEAARTKLTPELLAEGFAKTLRGELGPLADTRFGADLITAFQKFLNDPDELMVELAPTSPVPVTELLGLFVTNPNGIPERLGARVSPGQ